MPYVRLFGLRKGPVIEKLKNRTVDLGDISPANAKLLETALRSSAQGIQVDFDDGHCPTWTNTLRGLINLKLICHHTSPTPMSGLALHDSSPVLLVRPRAWNMVEQNVIIQGMAIPGALMDYGLHLFHNGVALYEAACRGPFFYLSKLENHREAKLWAKIFQWSEEYLGLAFGSIKSTVLIESINAVYEMDAILYELRFHSAGLNCGIWDYTASILRKFSHTNQYVLPDRNAYVSMSCSFMKSYMNLLISICHKRQAPATTGMIPLILAEACSAIEREEWIKKAIRGKTTDFEAGADGTLVYDIELVPIVQSVFEKRPASSRVTPVADRDFKESIDRWTSDLLNLPQGRVTSAGIRMNIQVSLEFILAWMSGQGTFILNGCVEDSATAEISRSQLWQWIRYGHMIRCDDEHGNTMDERMITPAFIQRHIQSQVNAISANTSRNSTHATTAGYLLFQLLFTPEFPDFITTFLSQQPFFHQL